MQRLTSVIPVLWKLRQVDHQRLGVQDQPGQYGETPSLLKVQKLAGHGGTCLQSQLLRRLRQENHLNIGGEIAVSQDCGTALQPGQQSETLSKKKKKNRVYGRILISLKQGIHRKSCREKIKMGDLHKWTIVYVLFLTPTYLSICSFHSPPSPSPHLR